MSLKLPKHPNLEHLKKQAKVFLRQMQQEDLNLKLADAQLAIAREYGFPSWPKLKAHVEALRLNSAAAEVMGAPLPVDQADLSGGSHREEGTDLPGEAAKDNHPFIGTWIANLAKTKQHPLNPIRAATLEFDVVDDTVSIIDVVVDTSGQEQRANNTIHVDGKEYPFLPRAGYTVLATWLGSHSLEAVVRKDGHEEGRVKYEASTDGTLLTISTADQVIVCDRQSFASLS